MEKHTSGKWKVSSYDGLDFIEQDGKEVHEANIICTFDCVDPEGVILGAHGHPSFAEQEANARLIASAPSMLYEIENFLDLYDNGVLEKKDYEALRNEINKARGE